MFFKKTKKDVKVDPSEKIMKEAAKNLVADLKDLKSAIEVHQEVLKKYTA